MIQIFRFNKKWRIKIVNETFEFDSDTTFSESLEKLLILKISQEPHK